MADIAASNWSETDASNSTAAPDGAPEGMNPSGVNDTIRAIMGAIKRLYDQFIPTTTAGTSTAYTLTYSVAPGALVDGMTFLVKFDQANGAAPTLNINTLGAKPLYRYSNGAWAAVASGEITANMVCRLSFNSAEGSLRIVSSSATAIGAAFVGLANAFTGNNTFAGTSTFSGTVTMTGKAINEAQGADIASASTTDIGAATGNYVNVTGTTTITALGTVQAGTRRVVKFAGALTLTHNATSLICLTGANITTAAGDVAEFLSEGSGNWRMTRYARADGTPLALNLGAASIGANGYQTLPSGLIMQWGTVSAAAGPSTVNVTFPTAFTTACYAVEFSRQTGGSGGNPDDNVDTVTTTGCVIHNNAGPGTIYYWFAVGK